MCVCMRGLRLVLSLSLCFPLPLPNFSLSPSSRPSFPPSSLLCSACRGQERTINNRVSEQEKRGEGGAWKRPVWSPRRHKQQNTVPRVHDDKRKKKEMVCVFVCWLILTVSGVTDTQATVNLFFLQIRNSLPFPPPPARVCVCVRDV